uniref:Uncharacterized protein n=1 Tax=Firmicutes phage HS08 TaxID=3056391 RepID=A0AA49X3Z5_9VIRU|nr:MAG: hypothetical protein [Firmicutes phage HS08]
MLVRVMRLFGITRAGIGLLRGQELLRNQLLLL